MIYFGIISMGVENYELTNLGGGSVSLSIYTAILR